MKSLIAFVAAIMAGCLAAPLTATAQVPGKPYAPCDTIVLDGISCLVISVDETGMHGKAMSPYLVKAKDADKMKKNAEKAYKKQVKKQEITEEDAAVGIAIVNSTYDKLPPLPDKKGESTDFNGFKSKTSDAWRWPTKEDVNDVGVITYGGIGKDYKYSGYKLLSICDNVSDSYWRDILVYATFYGFVYDENGKTHYIQRYMNNGGLKKPSQWLEDTGERGGGKEKVFFVRGF